MPERADEASIVLVWSRGNTLRVLIAAHDRASASTDPTHPARLSGLAAAKLRDLVETFNAFIDRDLEGQEIDRARLGPQERDDALTVVEAAVPIVEAIVESAIATPVVVKVITEQLEAARNVTAPGTNNDRATALLGRTIRNLVVTALRAGLIVTSWAAAEIVGNEAIGVVAGNPQPIVAFLINHAPELRSFADHVMHDRMLINILNGIARSGKSLMM